MKQNLWKWPNDKLGSNWSNLRGFKRRNQSLKWRDIRKWRKKNRKERCSLNRPKKKLKEWSKCKSIMPNLSLKDCRKWGLKRRQNLKQFKRAMRRKKDRERLNCKYKRRLSVSDSWSLQKSIRPSRWWGRKTLQVIKCWKSKGKWGLVGCTKRERVLKFTINLTRFQWATSRYQGMRKWSIRRWTHSLNTKLLL